MERQNCEDYNDDERLVCLEGLCKNGIDLGVLAFARGPFYSFSLGRS